MSTIITTAYHILVGENFQPIVSDLPGLLPALMWSDMLKVHVKNFHINQHQQTISRPG